MGYKAYLLDIEGTTTPIDFVTKVLFPYARVEFPKFLDHNGLHPEVVANAKLLAVNYDQDLTEGLFPPSWDSRPDPKGMANYVGYVMAHDRKVTGLKNLQGMIWEHGYSIGSLKGEIYPDVEPAFRRWLASGASIHIFSSGSVLAQKLLFQHLPEGDLTPKITSYFDTTTGPKRESESYMKIADSIGQSPSDILFLSDIIEEVNAARTAGMAATQVLRDGRATGFPESIMTFDEVPE